MVYNVYINYKERMWKLSLFRKKIFKKIGLLASMLLAFLFINLSTQSEVHAAKKYNWGYPFAKLTKKGVHPMYQSQTFGYTNYARSYNPLSYFHDGWDFGWSEVGHSTVKAVHPGKVVKVAYGNGLGWFIWIESPDKYVEIYQEGFKRKKDIKVKQGKHIKTGQRIGKLTGSHLHLGLTKTNKNYINKYGFPCNNWYLNNGTWLNPVKTIQNNI